jgi:hypothetical protein
LRLLNDRLCSNCFQLGSKPRPEIWRSAVLIGLEQESRGRPQHGDLLDSAHKQPPIGSIRRDEAEKLANCPMPLWRETLDGVKAKNGVADRRHRAKVREKMIVETKKFRIVSGWRN